MATPIALLTAIEPFPVRKGPQDRYDKTVNAAMSQLAVMVGNLNGDFIPKINSLDLAVSNNLADAKKYAEAAKAGADAASTALSEAKASATTAQNAAANARVSENNANTSAAAAETAALQAQACVDDAHSQADIAIEASDTARGHADTARNTVAEVQRQARACASSALEASRSADEAELQRRQAEQAQDSASLFAGQAQGDAQLVRESLTEIRGHVDEVRKAAPVAVEAARKAEESAAICADILPKVQNAREQVEVLEAGAKMYAALAHLAQKDTRAERERVREYTDKTQELFGQAQLLHDEMSLDARVSRYYACLSRFAAKIAGVERARAEEVAADMKLGEATGGMGADGVVVNGATIAPISIVEAGAAAPSNAALVVELEHGKE